VADEIISEFGEAVDTITLVRSSGGRFEVSVDGAPVFSKAQAHRHAEPGEVSHLIRKHLAASGRDTARAFA
jgi:selenoprotein W-related protein